VSEPKLHFEVRQTTATSRVVKVMVPAKVVVQILDEKIRALQKTATLQGFRKGKVPASVIRSRWLDQILDEIKGRLIEANTPTVMDQEQVDKKTVTGEPTIKKVKISEKKGLSYEIHLKTVEPGSVVDFSKPAPPLGGKG